VRRLCYSLQGYLPNLLVPVFPKKYLLLSRYTGNMVMNHFGFVILLLLAAGIVLVSGCTSPAPPGSLSPTPTPPPQTTVITTPPSPLQDCATEDDCVPAECCHPTSCINKSGKEVCTVFCTMSCEGPIDCGSGRCGCVDGTCSVVATVTYHTP
jgi:hypothetical protein